MTLTDQRPVLVIALATTSVDIASCLRLRRDVFIVEQGVSEADEIDGRDETCVHILATVDDQPVGAARLQRGDGYVKIQRVCIDKAHRGFGYGADLIRFAIDHMRADRQTRTARLGAQLDAISFYEKLGFKARGEHYLDAGIWHQDMELLL